MKRSRGGGKPAARQLDKGAPIHVDIADMQRRSPGNHSRKRGAGMGLVAGVKRVQFRVTPEQRQQLEAEALALKVTVGDVARRRIFGEGPPAVPPRAKGPAKGFIRGVLAVVLRVTAAQRELLETEAVARQMSPSIIARDRCFRSRA